MQVCPVRPGTETRGALSVWLGHPGSEVRSEGGLGAGSAGPASVRGNTYRRTLLPAAKKERAQMHEEATTVLHGGSELELG